MVGRRFWIVDQYEGLTIVSGPHRCNGLRQFLPAGEYIRERPDGYIYKTSRPRSLVQLWTDSGARTAAVACVWVRDPGKNSEQW